MGFTILNGKKSLTQNSMKLIRNDITIHGLPPSFPFLPEKGRTQ